MNVSELKKKILEGIRTNRMQEWAFMINDYDGIMDYEKLADEDIDELATAILNEIANQPKLNKNQQVVLGYLKEMMISFDLCNAIYRLESAEDWGHASEPYDIAYESLNDKERLQVVQAACQWAQEWEEPV